MGALGKSDSLEASVAEDPRAYSKLNLATTVVGFLVSVGTGLWFTPFLVLRLGPAAYGIIPLATTVVSYFSLLTQTLSSALNRSISVALAGGDMTRAGRAFSSALGGVIVIVLALLPFIAALSWAAPALFEVPAGEAMATRVLFAIVGATLLLSIISTPYMAIAFGQNKIYWSNFSALAQTAIRIGLTVLLFGIAVNIFNAGIAILVAALGGMVLSLVSARLNGGEMGIFRPTFHREELRSLTRTSSHVLLMQIGTVLTMSCEVVIANKLFGAYQGGRYAAVIQWLLLLRNANMALVVLCVPTILRLVGGIAQLLLGAVGVVIALLFGWQWGMIGVAIGVNWSFGIKELIFTPAYAARNIDAPARTFLKPLGTVGVLFCVAAALSWAGGRVFQPHSMVQLFSLGSGVGVVYAAFGFLAFRPMIMEAVATLFGRRGRVVAPK